MVDCGRKVFHLLLSGKQRGSIGSDPGDLPATAQFPGEFAMLLVLHN